MLPLDSMLRNVQSAVLYAMRSGLSAQTVHVAQVGGEHPINRTREAATQL